MIFIAYILVRLFTNLKELRVEGDEARHLRTARTFYKLWNNSFYDFHPPLYSLLIKIVSFVMPDYIAGILISFVSSLGLYWITVKTYTVLGFSSFPTSIALTFLTFNYTLIYFSNRIFRYQLFAFLFMSSFYCLLINQSLLAGLLWGLTLLTCSFNGLRFFWVWLLFGLITKNFQFEALSIAFLIYFYLWLVPKATLYNSRIYHPSGPEGKLDIVNPFTIKQLLSPMYFPFNYVYYGKKYMKKEFRHWHTRIMGVFGLYPVSLVLSIPFVIMVFFTVKGMLQGPLWLVIVVILLLLPSFDLKYRPRNSVMVIPLIGYFLGKGIENWHIPQIPLCVYSLLVGFLWYNRRCIFTIKSHLVGAVTSRILSRLPCDGILVEGLIAYPIAYNIDKRVVIMTHTPDIAQAKYETDLAIKHFDLHYAVFSSKYIFDYSDGYPVIDYIRSFKLIKTVKEDENEYYIYEIPVDSTTKETR